MNRNPKISVITPSYNQALFIEETIKSVISQKYENLEYIILDAESTDGSQKIIEKYSKYISYYVSEKDLGQANALNRGFKISTGDIICWLNSDDYFEINTLKQVAEFFLSNKVDFIYGNCVHFKDRKFKKKWLVTPGEITNKEITYFDPIQQPSTFWSREVMEKTGYLNEKYDYVFDWDFFIRISQNFSLTYVPSIFSYYRFHENHKTSTGGIKRSHEIMEIINKYSSSEWKSLYETVFPFSQELQELKSTWRGLFFVIFILKYPRLIFGTYRLNDLNIVAHMLC